MPATLLNYAADTWTAGTGTPAQLRSAVTGEVVAVTGSQGLNFAAMLDHARRVGGPALRAMTFHARARMLKSLAEAVMARKEELYALSWATGGTRADNWIDIEGGAGTLFAIASKGRRELPDDVILIDGDMETTPVDADDRTHVEQLARTVQVVTDRSATLYAWKAE